MKKRFVIVFIMVLCLLTFVGCLENEAEKVLATQETSQEDKRMARETILALSNRVEDVDDMLFIDDYVQEYLQKI